MQETKIKRAVFLDRDGTINEDIGYLGEVEKLKIFPGVIPALSLLKEKGFLLFIVTNQSGLGRGLFKTEALEKIHKKIEELFSFDGIYYCPHLPDENCSCRKPHPKMVLDVADKFKVNLKESFVIGDKLSDIEMGQRAGCRSILVLTGEGKESKSALAKENVAVDYIAQDVPEAADWIVKKAYVLPNERKGES